MISLQECVFDSCLHHRVLFSLQTVYKAFFMAELISETTHKM